MGVEYYVFAVFVFLLLCALVFLIWRFILLPRGRKSTAEAAEQGREKEERLFRLYQNIEEMMDNFEGYLEDTREHMETVKAEASRQQQAIEELIHRAEATEARTLAALETLRVQDRHGVRQEPQGPAPEKPAAEPGRKGRQGKRDAVRELLSKGMTVEQIAQKLELSINEVKLVVYGMMSKPADKK